MKRLLIILAVFLPAVFAQAAPDENGGSMKETNVAGTQGREIINFDKGWLFQREYDSPEMKDPAYKDKKWAKVNVPHDWAIEGTLKPKKVKYSAPVMFVIKGEWKFNKGDDAAWKDAAFDDSSWEKVKLPASWEDHSNYKEDNVYGWYRREIVVPASMKGKDVIFNCGMIDDVDETYVNGELVGSTGIFPPKYETAWNVNREYRIKSSLIKYGKKNIIAIRVFDGYGGGGIYGDKSQRLLEGPFDRAADGGNSTGFLPGGIGWYRKAFTVPEAMKGKKISVEFDGAYMDSETWLNGMSLGKHPYGYTPFSFDLTPYLKYGKETNMIVMRLNVKQQCTRWYSGAGIYRHVRLVAVDPVHIAKWGTYITTPDISENEAIVRIETTIMNEGANEEEVTLQTTILDKNNAECAVVESKEKIVRGSEKKFVQETKIAKPSLWSTETPDMYTAVSRVISKGAETDKFITAFGVRTIKFTDTEGFFLNGKHVPIKGVCLHHDNGYLGAAVHKRAIQRQLEIMKEMGANAVRTSHNPPDTVLLDLCDKMGLLVMDEAFDEWKENKTTFGYGRFFDEWAERDITTMLRRDRNHPSIIMWSIGNEVAEQWAGTAENAEKCAKMLADICRKEDPTRPVTAACNVVNNSIDKGIAKHLDVMGINYNITEYEKQRGKYKLIGSETSSDTSTRGEYNLVEKDGFIVPEGKLNTQCSSYDNFAPDWATSAAKSLQMIKDSPWVAGEFVWTGFDYIGESTPYWWPAVISYFGITDLCGFPKDRYYTYQSKWTEKPMVHVLPHWNWEKWKGKEIPVIVDTNCESVELFLNGKSFGEKKRTDSAGLRLEWKVPYSTGILRASAKNGGVQAAEDQVRTAGKPVRIEIKADRTELSADGEDLSYVTVRMLDKYGTFCPTADNEIEFTLEGDGDIAATGNGNPLNHAFFNAAKCRAFNGMVLAIVKAGEKPSHLYFTASSKGLKADAVNIETK